MKTYTINPKIAAKLVEEIENAGIHDYAEFMGLQSHSSTDIEDLTLQEIMEAAEISEAEAEIMLAAISIADRPGLFGAYQILCSSAA